MTDAASAEAVLAPPAAAPPRRAALRMRRLVEYASVVTALSFLVAIWVNQLVFNAWGLRFIQLATVTDVLMSGLAVMGTLIPFSIAYLIGYYLGRRRKQLKLFWWAYALLFFLLLAGGLLVLAVEGPTDGDPVVFALCGVALGGLATPPVLRLRERGVRWWRPVFLVASAALAAAFVIGVTEIVDVRARSGYAKEPLHLVQASPAGCVGHLLWAGERALVLDCDDNLQDHRDVVVIYAHENREFRRHLAPPPKQPASRTS